MSDQPNILVICSDQHHPRMLGYRGHACVQTPNLDRLAQNGTAFTRAYCNSPICVPSRMSFITGKYTHQIDSWSIGIPLPRDEMTWARRLDQAGIPSTMLGKMDFCGDYQDGGFTHHKIIRKRSAWREIPKTAPDPCRLDGYSRPDKLAHIANAGTRSAELMSDGDFPGEMYDEIGNFDHDRIVTNWAVDYLREKGKQGASEPWACYVGLLMPHWPFCVPDAYFNQYYPDNIELPIDYHTPNENLHPALAHFQRCLNLESVTEDMLRRAIAAYYGLITCMDTMVGEILDALEQSGCASNTYVVYMTDHGESLGEHGLFYKQCSYEGSVGVPLLVSGPGLPSGQTIDHPVTLVDLYPTILDMVDMKTEPDRPGTSWLPLIRGEDHERPDYAFAEFQGNFIKHGWCMLVRGRYKYTYYINDRPSLFDIERDPHELNDLAGDPKYGETLAQFEALLRSIVDPEAVALRAKRDFGLIGPDGEDYTLTMSVPDLA